MVAEMLELLVILGNGAPVYAVQMGWVKLHSIVVEQAVYEFLVVVVVEVEAMKKEILGMVEVVWVACGLLSIPVKEWQVVVAATFVWRECEFLAIVEGACELGCLVLVLEERVVFVVTVA